MDMEFGADLIFRKVDVGKFSGKKRLLLALLLIKSYFNNVVCGQERSQKATRRPRCKLGRVTARNYISRQNTIVKESVQWALWSGPARRRGRGVSDGGPAAGSVNRTEHRSDPFFRLNPAFGLRSLRKNGYVLVTIAAIFGKTSKCFALH